MQIRRHFVKLCHRKSVFLMPCKAAGNNCQKNQQNYRHSHIYKHKIQVNIPCVQVILINHLKVILCGKLRVNLNIKAVIFVFSAKTTINLVVLKVFAGYGFLAVFHHYKVAAAVFNALHKRLCVFHIGNYSAVLVNCIITNIQKSVITCVYIVIPIINIIYIIVFSQIINTVIIMPEICTIFS